MVSKIKMHRVIYSDYVRGSTKIIFKSNLAVGNLMYLRKWLNPIKFPRGKFSNLPFGSILTGFEFAFSIAPRTIRMLFVLGGA